MRRRRDLAGLIGPAFLLTFGVVVLLLLVAVDRPHWFGAKGGPPVTRIHAV